MHFGRRQSAHQFLCGAQFLPAVAAGQGLGEPGALHPEPGGAQRVGVLVEEAQRPSGELQGPFAFAAEAAGDGGLGQQVEVAQRPRGVVGAGVVAAGRRGRVGLGVVERPQSGAHGVGDGVPQLHRPFEQAELLGEGVAPTGHDGGVEDGGQGLGGVVGVVPVAGEPGGPLVGGDERGVGLQRLGETAVEPGALTGQQVVADGLADQGVPEAVAVAVGRGGEDAGVDGGAQGLDEVVLAESRDGG